MSARTLPLLGAPPSPPAAPRFAVAAKGFRPFFLLAAVFAAAALPIWMLAIRGLVRPGDYLDPMSWHAHEMVFGFAVAVIAGFLLTAVGNWTQRETAIGYPLLGLAALWCLGRIAMAAGGLFPKPLVAALDLAFLPALAVVIARPLVLARAHKHFVMLGVLASLFAANAAVHLDALGLLAGGRQSGTRAGVDLVVLVILVIAGRVFPMFTRNATGVATIRSHPRLDVASLLAMLAVTVLDVALPASSAMLLALALAASLAVARAAHWGTWHARKEPLLWILHLGYAWIPVGLAMRAVAMRAPAVPPSLGLHALTAGAIGCLTLGMMVRVTLGHGGRAMKSPHAATAAFGAMAAAAAVRVFGPLVAPASYLAMVIASASLFAGAFVLYLVACAPVLLTPRADGKPG